MAARKWRVAVAGFDHMHAGDQIEIVQADPDAVLVGVWDADGAKMTPVADDLGVDAVLQFTDIDELVKVTRPDIVIVCSTTADHLSLVERLAPHGIHLILEKPFAVSIKDADAMISAVTGSKSEPRPTLSINWPLAWYPSHRTTRRLISEGAIGDVLEVHYYNGNRGPLHHIHGKADAGHTSDKSETWWYSAEAGGGSLLDYLGYGATLATWFRDGELPDSVTARTAGTEGVEVDEQSVVIATYSTGLSVLQTKWGTLTDPWRIQGFPKHGFVVVGTAGTISSQDYSDVVEIQTLEVPEPTTVPVDVLAPAERTALAYLISRLETGSPIEGPSSWEISRGGQLIVDAARQSARTGTDIPIRK